jgi:hypothetical protein
MAAPVDAMSEKNLLRSKPAGIETPRLSSSWKKLLALNFLPELTLVALRSSKNYLPSKPAGIFTLRACSSSKNFFESNWGWAIARVASMPKAIAAARVRVALRMSVSLFTSFAWPVPTEPAFVLPGSPGRRTGWIS